MRKPNPFKHMIVWGICGGVSLGVLYGISIVFLVTVPDMNSFSAWLREIPEIIMFGAYFGAMFGGVPGLILGTVDGLVLWSLLRKVEIPISIPDLLVHQKRAQWIIAITTFIGCYVIAFLLTFGLMSVFIVGIPSLIAAFAAFVVTRRYFVRLAQYAEKGKRKAKEA